MGNPTILSARLVRLACRRISRKQKESFGGRSATLPQPSGRGGGRRTGTNAHVASHSGPFPAIPGLPRMFYDDNIDPPSAFPGQDSHAHRRTRHPTS
ncbi:hypothetical protein BGL_1c18690 [Burkholderia plantarii]|uniref:Uncharacterized protein n=1 Tax=Burkholderia plantarii TaxID=41899 RepID=A0A0B6RSP7_BURPL|nr:hypothetical protein BGL_1c18690 [Burkholderia plantarii]